MGDRFRIIAVEVDGFTLGKRTRFTSVDDSESNRKAAEQTVRWHTCANIHELKELLF